METPSWSTFPLSLDGMSAATVNNTVFYPRTLSLSSLEEDNLVATDGVGHRWAYISEANVHGDEIKGWVSISSDDAAHQQAHVKRASPWEWIGFKTIEEQANTGELALKMEANKAVRLDLADYTKGMSALHHILTQTPMNTTLSKKDQLPPFTASHLKAGLRTSWTAEQIGRLAIKYESEWYADSSLSKWNEIDHFYQTTCENKRQRILAELDECHITKPAEREYPLKLLSEQYQSHIDTWQIEKAQRIKPSLWWDEVAKAQVSQTANTDTATTDNTPVLSNLSLDGKAWFLHPVCLLSIDIPIISVESFISEYKKRHKDFSIGGNTVNAASEKNLRDILSEINKFYILTDEFKPNKFKLAYMLATARHEAYHYLTGEFFSKKPEIGSLNYFNKYDPILASTEQLRKRAIKNGNTVEGDGYKYRGRGLVHLTWKNNYQAAQDYFNVDFVGNPEKAADFKYSIPIMIWGMEKGMFTTKKLSDYININNIDYLGARQIINGSDRKEEISNNAKIFEEILEQSMYISEEL